MFKLLKEHETRGSLSLREQSWMNERMEFKEEIQKFRLDAAEKKRQLEQKESWHKDQSVDTSQKIKLLETDLQAKLEDAERYKQINDKQHRALISQEEKGKFTFDIIFAGIEQLHGLAKSFFRKIFCKLTFKGKLTSLRNKNKS